MLEGWRMDFAVVDTRLAVDFVRFSVLLVVPPNWTALADLEGWQPRRTTNFRVGLVTCFMVATRDLSL